MDIQSIKREGHRFLLGLENGSLASESLYAISETLDPILVYFIIKHLRKIYNPGHPDAMGVTQRIVELSTTYQSIIKAIKDGEKDSLNEWFEDDLNSKQYQDDSEKLIEILVEKIEG